MINVTLRTEKYMLIIEMKGKLIGEWIESKIQNKEQFNVQDVCN